LARSKRWRRDIPVIGHHAKWRDDIFLKILVLIVAPDHDKVGVELVENPPRVAKSGEQALSMARSGRDASVVAVLLAHRLWPARRMAEPLGDGGIIESAFQDPAHIFVRPRQRRKVGDAETQDLCHSVFPPKDRPARIGFGRTRNKHREIGGTGMTAAALPAAMRGGP
jgi:hypothetical protein